MSMNLVSCVVSTKIQILKAIHNCRPQAKRYWGVVLYLRKYKFWKQFTTLKLFLFFLRLLCCIYENTNFESNSQPFRELPTECYCCVVSTKIQILKAIHNPFLNSFYFVIVVLYLRKYKFWKQFTTVSFIFT